MAIHLYKTSTPSTRNGAVDSQTKSNTRTTRKNLIYGQHRYGKGRNARGIITARHRGGKEFWAEAANTTIFLLNRLLTKAREGRHHLKLSMILNLP